MTSVGKQKMKMVKLLEILRQNTDEQHPLSTSQLIYRLEEYGITAERKTIYEDIKLLCENGYEIMCSREKSNRYYVEDRHFDVAELRILLDSVQAASFITKKKSAELVDKLASLAGSNRAELLKRNIVVFDTVKHSNEVIYYSVDALDRAIVEGKTVSFRYFDYDVKGEKRYRRDGQRYLVSPVALIFTKDNYYLITYSDKHGSLVHYRVDRMDGVTAEETSISETALRQKEKMPQYKSEIFDMYGGPFKVAEFEADIALVDSVTDKFGERLCMRKISGSDSTSSECDRFSFKANVRMAPTFFAWIATFGGKLKLIGDEELVNGYREFLANAAKGF